MKVTQDKGTEDSNEKVCHRWTRLVLVLVALLMCSGIWRYWYDWELPRRQAITLHSQIQEEFEQNGVVGYANVLFYFNCIEFHGDIRADDIRLVAPLINNQNSWLLSVEITDTKVKPDEVEGLQKSLSKLVHYDKSD